MLVGWRREGRKEGGVSVSVSEGSEEVVYEGATRPMKERESSKEGEERGRGIRRER